jgi:ABC-type branched-subunit amino acid transport system ATPase component
MAAPSLPNELRTYESKEQMIKLSLRVQYKSLRPFRDLEMPAFSLVVGVNGSGKTQLFQALANGRAKAQIGAVFVLEREILQLDWTRLVAGQSVVYDSSQIARDVDIAWNALEGARSGDSAVENEDLRDHWLGLRSALSEFGLADRATSLSEIARLAPVFSSITVNDKQPSEKLVQSVSSVVAAFDNSVTLSLKNSTAPHIFRGICTAATSADVSVLALEEGQLRDGYVPGWEKNEGFDIICSRLFTAHRDLALKEKIRTLDNRHASSVNVTALAPAPWLLVNRLLEEAKSPFRVKAPNPHDWGRYQPEFEKSGLANSLRMGDLSAGEQVLVSLALCLYYGGDSQKAGGFPRLILLDEIDAPLHPCLARDLMVIVKKVLVDEHGLYVIATTHSPSTAATFPEDSIFVLDPKLNGLQKVSQTAAISSLTEGIPTLSISLDGRRQVFVEDPSDAGVYSAIYMLLKTDLRSERSLEFIATGMPARADGSGRVNTGCDVVKKLAKALDEAGASTVRGLIDWDTEHDPVGNVHVFSHRERYTVENALLDPLPVAALVSIFGSAQSMSEPIHRLLKRTPESLQAIVDRIQSLMMMKDVSHLPKVNTSYVGGLTLKITTEFLRTPGKIYIEQVLKLAAPNKIDRSNLNIVVAEKVFRQAKDFIPKAFFETFEQLLNS